MWSTGTKRDQENAGASQSLDDILGICNTAIEPNLLRRFLRHIAALSILEETGRDACKPPLLSWQWAIAGCTSTRRFDAVIRDHTVPAGVNLAHLLAKYAYKDIVEKTKFDKYMDLFGDDFFVLCQKNLAVGGSFIGLVTALRNHNMDWTDIYNTTRIVEGAESGTPLFVDVGGAHGLDTARLLSRHPDLPVVALVLQDLPDVVETHAKEQLDERIDSMAHDFFTLQPVVGSRAYLFHAVPHELPDADRVCIFNNIKPAMEKAESKLLVYEVVIPAKVLPLEGTTNLMTTLDLQLVNCTSALERTEEH